MARPSHREKLLHVGMQVVHARGFAGASVRDIVQAAGVPQGSFTNHFASKEAFGLEVIDLFGHVRGLREITTSYQPLGADVPASAQQGRSVSHPGQLSGQLVGPAAAPAKRLASSTLLARQG
jgi:AcrR family transcriptional regulator